MLRSLSTLTHKMITEPNFIIFPFRTVSNATLALSFHSLVFRISLVNFKQGISLVILVFSLSFPRILWVRQ